MVLNLTVEVEGKKMKQITFRVEETIFNKSKEIRPEQQPSQLAKEIFLEYIQERTTPTPTPEQMREYLIELRPRVRAYMHGANFLYHKLLCEWICEKYKITQKQFYESLLKLLHNSKLCQNENGRWIIICSKGLSPNADDIIVNGERYKFVQLFEDSK
jgi:hypothetical protein